MFRLEKTYDIRELVRSNTHLHTTCSTFAKPEMTLEAVIAEAERCRMHTVATTDHSDLHDGINTIGNARKLMRLRDKLNPKVRVLIGAELSCYGVGKFAEPYRIDSELEYRNYTCNHYHLEFWEQPEDKSPAGYGKHMIAMLEGLFRTDRADCVAHPFGPYKIKCLDEAGKIAVLDSIADNALGDILTMGERARCAWELHTAMVRRYPEFYRRFFQIGREAGVHFEIGTDAHSLRDVSPAPLTEELERILL